MKKTVNTLVKSGFIMMLVTLMLVLAHSNAFFVTFLVAVALWLIGAIVDDKLTWKNFNK